MQNTTHTGATDCRDGRARARTAEVFLRLSAQSQARACASRPTSASLGTNADWDQVDEGEMITDANGVTTTVAYDGIAREINANVADNLDPQIICQYVWLAPRPRRTTSVWDSELDSRGGCSPPSQVEFRISRIFRTPQSASTTAPKMRSHVDLAWVVC
jgi:hypothetical protein